MEATTISQVGNLLEEEASFSNNSIVRNVIISLLPNLDIDSIKDQVEGCLTLPPTYMTVVSRCQLAQQLHDLGKEMSRKCEQLTHDQHLQHQGWAAVVGNLEDIITSFKKRVDLFQITYNAHSEEKEEQLKLLDGCVVGRAIIYNSNF